MTLEEFRLSLLRDEPPSGLGSALLGLWWDGKGDWDRAHAAVADGNEQAGAWVHAYLHRREGDAGNARYWYRVAERPPAEGALSSEWESLVSALLPVAARE